ncbi:pentatricopeptide repeat-containing protein At2g33680-like [Selaginella moellendorffii]|uniref:pentatricopeptide repeat-containing protein At2g33680-like n=1 Tax=Selaginella moellendorffii TaxID=88036 RepID=UPI000D1CA2A4|nr:pentatricopeptide repeat-containing protein At2g33680-like [Selaginella moellendorffii]|eukprot:XP_024535306.1 pentatricopeptide repeat-containing protein At2g33680-like [Selaginella moellendorffii]
MHSSSRSRNPAALPSKYRDFSGGARWKSSVAMSSSLGLEIVEAGGVDSGKSGAGNRKVDRATSIVLAALKSCRDLRKGRKIHAEMAHDRESNIYVATALVNMYSKCGSLAEAKRVFDQMEARDVVSWTAMILGYAESGKGDEALKLFESMEALPNSRAFVAALKACSALATREAVLDGKIVKVATLAKAKDLHARAASAGFDTDIFVANTLVDVYAKCGAMELAREVFDRAALRRTVVSWNALMLGYAGNGEENVALELFAVMLREDGFPPDSRSFLAALKACSSLAAREEARRVDGRLVKLESLKRGMEIYAQAVSSGFDTDLYVASTVVDMFAKCGNLVQARRVFDRMEHRNSVAWNALILGYAENDEEEVAVDLFRRMGTGEACAPDGSTFIAVLKACIGFAEKESPTQIDGKVVKFQALRTGMGVHSQALNRGCHRDSFVENVLVDMYATCASLVDAHRVFDRIVARDVVSWTALMRGYTETGEPEVALDLFQEMFGAEACWPNARSYLVAIKACTCLAEKEPASGNEELEQEAELAKVGALEKGMAIHSRAAQDGLVASNVFVPSSLVDMYTKCGSMVDARRVFDEMSKHDVVSWTALILGYAENGHGDLALESFSRMQREGCLADSRTYAALVKACASAATLGAVKAAYGEVCRQGLEDDASLATSLIDCFGKCGTLIDAQLVFDSISTIKDPVCWSTIISAYSRQGDTQRVFSLFNELVEAGQQADGVTYLCLLTACGHSGLVETGKKYFEAMLSSGGIAPAIEHYHSMIDLLGRANKLNEAVDMARSMPYEATDVTWRTLLGACHKWKNVELGRIAFRELIRVDAKDSSAYAMMANLSPASEEFEGG